MAATQAESDGEEQKLGEAKNEQGLTTKAYTPDWILETVKATESDHRKQPWRGAFTEAVDSRFDDEEDLVRVEPAVGVEIDPACPFRTQGSSLAA